MLLARMLHFRISTLICLLLLSVTASHAQKAPHPIQEAGVVDLRPGISAEELRSAHVVRVKGSISSSQLTQLSSEQLIETSNGKRIKVGSYRQLQQYFSAGAASGGVRHEMQVPILQTAHGKGSPIVRGTTPQQLLSRPDTDLIQLSSGNTVSVAQLKALVPYVERVYGVQLHGVAASRSVYSGPASHIQTAADLKNFKNAPDSTVLESPKGTRVTLGDLRHALGLTPQHMGAVLPPEVTR